MPSNANRIVNVEIIGISYLIYENPLDLYHSFAIDTYGISWDEYYYISTYIYEKLKFKKLKIILLL